MIEMANANAFIVETNIYHQEEDLVATKVKLMSLWRGIQLMEVEGGG